MCNHENFSEATSSDWESVCADCGVTLRGQLFDYTNGDYIREATAQEYHESLEASLHDGGCGVILVDGRRCYAME